MKLLINIPKKTFTEITLLIFSILIFELIDKTNLFVGQIIFCIALFSNIQLIYKYRKIDIFILFLLFSFMHLIYIGAYYFFGIPYHYLLKNQSLYNTNTIFFIQIIVLRLLFLGIDSQKFIVPRFKLPVIKDNTLYWFFISILIILIPLSTIGKETISSASGGYSIDTDGSIWSEYCIIFIIISSLFASSKTKIYILICLSLIFVIIPLLYGRRLASIMVILTIFNLYFSNIFSTKKILLFFIISFVLLRVFDSIRIYGFSFDINVINILLSVDKDTQALSNGPGGVLVCSVTYLSLIEAGVFDLWFSFKSFIGMFTGVFTRASSNIAETYINTQALKYDDIPGNGGFPGIYFYLWGRYFGVIIGGLFLNYLIRKSQKSNIFAVYCLFLLSVFPRWYTYNLHFLVKMGFWLMLIVFATGYFSKQRKV